MVSASHQINIEALTDEELRKKLKDLGENVGPITQTTRNLYQKKLKRVLEQLSDQPINEYGDENIVDSHQVKTRITRSSKKLFIDENDNLPLEKNSEPKTKPKTIVSPPTPLPKNDKVVKNKSEKLLNISRLNSNYRTEEMPHNTIGRSSDNGKDETSNPYPLIRSRSTISGLTPMKDNTNKNYQKNVSDTNFFRNTNNIMENDDNEDYNHVSEYLNRNPKYRSSGVYRRQSPTKQNLDKFQRLNLSSTRKDHHYYENEDGIEYIDDSYYKTPEGVRNKSFKQTRKTPNDSFSYIFSYRPLKSGRNNQNYYLNSNIFANLKSIAQKLYNSLLVLTPSVLQKLLTALFTLALIYLLIVAFTKNGFKGPKKYISHSQSSWTKSPSQKDFKSQITNIQCQTEDTKCLQEQNHLVIPKLARLIYTILSNKAGKDACSMFKSSNSMSGNMSTDDIILQLKSRYPKTSHQELNDYLLAVLAMFHNNPHWGIELSDKFGVAVSSPHEVYWLKCLKPKIPLWCRIAKIFAILFGKFLTILLALTLLSCLGYGFFAFLQKRRKNQEQIYEMLHKVIEFVEENDRMHRTDPINYPYGYVALTHVRDMLISPQNRKAQSKLWECVCDQINQHESRLRLETQTISGEPFDVWRWLPSVTTTRQQNTPKTTFKQNNIEGLLPEKDNNYLNTNNHPKQIENNFLNKNSCLWQGPAFDTLNQIGAQGLTPCLKIRNMFNRNLEMGNDWPEKIKNAILVKCGPAVEIVHMVIDHESPEGCVYLKCQTCKMAGEAYRALHGWWFAGNLVSVKYLRPQRYSERFPDSDYSNAPLRPNTIH